MTIPSFLPDTHALFWFEFDPGKLSQAARQTFDDAERGQAELILHPIVLAEFYYVVRKAGHEQDFVPYVQFLDQSPVYRLEAIASDDLKRLPSFSEIPEMHDRLIAITANRLNVPIISKDATLQASSQISCVW